MKKMIGRIKIFGEIIFVSSRPVPTKNKKEKDGENDQGKKK